MSTSGHPWIETSELSLNYPDIQNAIIEANPLASLPRGLFFLCGFHIHAVSITDHSWDSSSWWLTKYTIDCLWHLISLGSVWTQLSPPEGDAEGTAHPELSWRLASFAPVGVQAIRAQVRAPQPFEKPGVQDQYLSVHEWHWHINWLEMNADLRRCKPSCQIWRGATFWSVWRTWRW